MKMKIENWEQINDDMQRGYSYAANNKSIQACREWKKTWRAIVAAMDSGGYASLEDFDEDFPGLQSVYNWASDYELELYDSLDDDYSLVGERLSFCTEYFARVAEKEVQNSLNMRSAIANSYFRLGMEEEGEKRYMALTGEYPTWGWGWAHWADEYCDREGEKGYARAIEILNEALNIDGIKPKFVINERLKDTYEKIGMQEEADLIDVDEWDYGVPLSEIRVVFDAMKGELDALVNEIFEPLADTDSQGEDDSHEPQGTSHEEP